MKQQPLFALAIAASLLALTGVQAMTKDEYTVAGSDIEANFQTAKAACGSFDDSARDVCFEQAQGTRAVARAELEQLYKPSPVNARKVAAEKAKAAFEVSRMACGALSGDARSACAQQAQTDHDRAKADFGHMKG
jgi:glutamate synthase domain-containing protein 2